MSCLSECFNAILIIWYGRFSMFYLYEAIAEIFIIFKNFSLPVFTKNINNLLKGTDLHKPKTFYNKIILMAGNRYVKYKKNLFVFLF